MLVPRNYGNISVKSVFYLERFQRYGVLKKFTTFWATLYEYLYTTNAFEVVCIFVKLSYLLLLC